MRLPHTSLPTQLSIFAAVLCAFSLWLGAILAFISVWLYIKEQPSAMKAQKHWLLIPLLLAPCVFLFNGTVPPDDLLRHLMAWKIDYRYPAQYPWSDLPKANFWLGFDWALGYLQSQWGVSAQFLLQGVPALAFVLGGGVLYASMQKASPHASPAAFLLLGLLGLILIAPRMFLGRPEAFISIAAAAVWLCDTRAKITAWVLLMLLCIPVYWLGWAYAPFALLLPITWRARIGIAAFLAGANLLFWQIYTGDYLGMMMWLKGTLSVQANENISMGAMLLTYTGLAFALILAAVLARLPWANIKRITFSSSVWKHRELGVAPVLLLLWLALPNQVRYNASLVFALLPWMLQNVTQWEISNIDIQEPAWLKISPFAILCALVIASFHMQLPPEDIPRFAMKSGDRVLSENAYATVFFAKEPVQVEPSFALGATRPQWEDLLNNKDTKLDCALVRQARFTHVIEKSLGKGVACLELEGIQGAWRLWRVR